MILPFLALLNYYIIARQVPKDRPFLPEIYVFLLFLKKIAGHDMFDMVNKDKPFPIDEEEVNENEFE